MCDFPPSAPERPQGPIVFDDNETLILAHETLGRRLLQFCGARIGLRAEEAEVRETVIR
jgi:hypothetical protein